MSVGKRLWYTALLALVPLALVIVGYVVFVLSGTLIVRPHTDGTISGLGLQAPVQIMRDARGVPHIRAGSAHDAAFAQGYATGSDRLFQLDITRRFVLGTLSEMLGGTTLTTDENARVIDVRGIVDREYAHLSVADKSELQAYADGVNAAAEHEPPAPEYRALVYRFAPWKPRDSLAVGYAVGLDLTDSWWDVIARDLVARDVGPFTAEHAFFSLTDPGVQAPSIGGPHVVVSPLPALEGAHAPKPVAWNGDNIHDVLGSNEWVAGAAHTSTGRALLANDPHLMRRIPGIWHLVDVSYPGSHIAGAAIAGVPGVVLGHNDTLAWGATYADAVSPRVYAESFVAIGGDIYVSNGKNVRASIRHESFSQRFGKTGSRDYLSTKHGFVLENAGVNRHAVQWAPMVSDTSPIGAFLALDRAATIEAGLTALSAYPGPTQNFALAQTDGRAGFTVAGEIPNDPAWGRSVTAGGSAPVRPLTFVPFAHLPHIAPSRSVLANNSNNVPYAAGYPFRLSAYYSPPYRAAEIAARLAALPKIDVEASRLIQADTMSLAERELARMAVKALHASGADTDADIAPAYGALASFDGKFDPDSQGATVAQRLRVIATRDLIASHMSAAAAASYLPIGPAFVTLMRALREHPRGWFVNNDPAAFLVTEMRETIREFGGKDAVMAPYGQAYRVKAEHPFGSLGLHLWDAPSFTGSGGSYSPAVQGIVLGQSFRAVWDVGAWDNGGIDLPLGESGEPGAPHYTDAAGPWQRHELTPLPFGDAAVARATVSTLTLAP